jgi:hypothetical protein
MYYNLRSRNNMGEVNQQLQLLNDNINALAAQQGQLMQRPSAPSQFTMTFAAKPGEDAARFIDVAVSWCDLYKFDDAAALVNLLNIALSGPARAWLVGLANDVKQDRNRLVAAFREQFVADFRWLQQQQLWSRSMQPGEKLEDYIYAIDVLCAELKKSDDDKMMSFIKGLPVSLKADVVKKQPTTWKEAINAARLVSFTTSTCSTEPAMPSPAKAQASASITSLPPSYAPEVFSHHQQLQSALATPTQPPITASSPFQQGAHAQLPYGAQGQQGQLQYSAPSVQNQSSFGIPGPYGVPYQPQPSYGMPMSYGQSPYGMQMPFSSVQPSPYAMLPQSTAKDQTVTTLMGTVDELAQKIKQLEVSKVCGIQSGDNSSVHVVCQLCGGSHSALKCFRYSNKQNKSPKANIKCYSCNRYGHKSYECRSKRGNTAFGGNDQQLN